MRPGPTCYEPRREGTVPLSRGVQATSQPKGNAWLDSQDVPQPRTPTRRVIRSALAIVLALLVAGAAGCSDGGNGVPSSSDHPRSVSEARKATQENPEDAQAWRDLTTALQKNGDREGAISALGRYIDLRPEDVDARRELGVLYLAQADRQRNAQLPQRAQASFEKAVDAYRELVAVVPKDPYAQIELAQAAEQAGDRRTAIAAYTTYLRLAPTNPNAPLVRRHLTQLKKASTTSAG